jgi:alanine racemase
MTHFAEADADGGEACIRWQFERFARMLGDWPQAAARLARQFGGHPALPGHRSTGYAPASCSTAAAPLPSRMPQSLGLQPVMTLRSKILAVQDLAAGERVGYGGTFVAARPTRIGVVACGYADGYPRHAPRGTPIVVMPARRTQTMGGCRWTCWPAI